MPLQEFRQAFRQTTDNGIFFDNASMGPVIPEVTAAMAHCMELRQSMPMKYYRYAEELFPRCRARLAALTGAEPDEIAFTENVAYGINSAAGALPLSPGENVIVCDREFSSNIYPWLNLQRMKGVEARIIPHDAGGLTVERLEQYADDGTKAVSVSSVEFSDGYAADLEAIGAWCRSHGAFFIVDCAQSLGVRPMDVKRFGIDMMAGLSSKWLLGPFSTGFLYVKRELLPRLNPPFVGADSVTTDVDSVSYRLELKPDASRFELGLPNAPGIAGLDASLEFMEAVGMEHIYREAWEVSGYFLEKLRELEVELAPCTASPRTRSSIISFRTEDAADTYQYLRSRRIACSLRCGYLRMGIHGYNTKEEADQVIRELKAYLGSVHRQPSWSVR